MPFFLDCHSRSRDVSNSQTGQQNGRTLTGVYVIQRMNVESKNKDYCLLEAPDQKAVEIFHALNGTSCEWIEEVTFWEEIQVQ